MYSTIEKNPKLASQLLVDPKKIKTVKDSPVTDIPESAEVLGTTVLGRSWLTETIPTACTCGLELGLYLKEMSTIFLYKKNTFDEIASEYQLNGCCRMKVLAPFVTPVVSLDLGAKQINNTKSFENLEIPTFDTW